MCLIKVLFSPPKHGAGSSEAPEAENTNVGERSREDFRCELCRDGGDDIKDEPTLCISNGDELMIIDKEVCCFVEVGNEEGQNYVDGEECVDNVVRDGERAMVSDVEADFVRGDPCCVEH